MSVPLSGTWGRVFALLYDPFLWAGEVLGIRKRRSELLAHARGRVLEIGAGTGLNLAHYPAQVDELILTEPEEPMARRLERKTDRRVVRAGAERLPFDDASFDTVVSTFVLCTVSDAPTAIAEIKRVLAPGGSLLLLEHVRAAPGSRLEKWQDRLHGPWHAFACGCHDNRDTPALLAAAGFDVSGLERFEWKAMPPIIRPAVQGVAIR